MKREQIEQWAREAGFSFANDHDPKMEQHGLWQRLVFERFAALVAAAEREACAQLCEQLAELSPPGDTDADAIHGCAAAIRARGTP